MATAFQKVYTKISQITKATCSLKAKGVGYNELATINGKLAQVVKIIGDDVTLQVFEGTGGIPTNAEVVFLGKAPSLKVSEQLAGRFFKSSPANSSPQVLQVLTSTTRSSRVRRFPSSPTLTSPSTK